MAKSTTEKGNLMEAANKAKARMRAAGVLVTRNPIEKAKNAPKSLRMAVNAMCYHCQGGHEDGDHDPGWQWGVGNCTVLGCPLYPHRPYQDKIGAPPEGVYR